jgi:hypothetical protein
VTDYRQAMLRVNGIPLRLASSGGGPTVSWEDMAATTDRNQSGTMNKSRRASKRLITAKTAPHTWMEAAAIADLVEGKGVATGFDEPSPYMLNSWRPGTLIGTGTALQTTSYYLPDSLALPSGSAAQVQFTAMGGVISGPYGLAINMWSLQGGAGEVDWVTLTKTGGLDGGIMLYHPAGTNVGLKYGTVQTVTSANKTWGSDWHMITGVIRDTTATSYPGMSLYFDGVPVASAALPAQPFIYNDRDILLLGSAITTTNAGTIDELTVYPFPLSDTQVAGLYAAMSNNAATGIGPSVPVPYNQHKVRTLPRVLLSGDGLGDTFYAIGHVVGAASMASYRDPVTGGLLTNARTLDLQFMEI